MYQYPYGNAQQLNLDWILSKIQELEAGSTALNIEEVANALISASFDAGVSYRRYDYCFYNGKLYRALNDTTGAFNPADWLEVVIGDDIPVLTRLLNAVDAGLTSLQNTVNDLDSDDIDNASTVVSGATVTDALETLNTAINGIQEQITANIETSTTASKAYSIGEYLVLNGTLYRVTANIANGGTITVNTNVVATSTGNELTNLISVIGWTSCEVYDFTTLKHTYVATDHKAKVSNLGKDMWLMEVNISEGIDISDVNTMLVLKFPNYAKDNLYGWITGGVCYAGVQNLTAIQANGTGLYLRPNITKSLGTTTGAFSALFIINKT